MSFRTVSPDFVEAVAYKRDVSAQDVLVGINYLLGDEIQDDEPQAHGYGRSVYKITIKIEPV